MEIYTHSLGNMTVEGEGDDLLLYTRKWLAQVNRGGLFPLNSDSFSLFVEIARIHYSVSKYGQRGICIISSDCDSGAFLLHSRLC